MPARPSTAPGYAVYTPRTLGLYDLWVLRVSNGWIWRCPTQEIVELYNASVSGEHLDVGVGTGYFLDRCRFPVEQPRIALVDANPACLAAAAARIGRYRPRQLVADVLEPLPADTGRFRSIGVNYLLHCLPGDLRSKAAVFDHLLPHLEPGGVLFGSTLLSDGVRRGVAARLLMAYYNRRGIFSNRHDRLDDLRQALAGRFARFEVRCVGAGALFRAWR